MKNFLGVPFTPYNGYKLISSPAMQTAILEKRTWKERLFSLPFRPFKRMKIVGYKPLDYVIKTDDTIYGAPQTIELLQRMVS
jgi:hypothetical protein